MRLLSREARIVYSKFPLTTTRNSSTPYLIKYQHAEMVRLGKDIFSCCFNRCVCYYVNDDDDENDNDNDDDDDDIIV